MTKDHPPSGPEVESGPQARPGPGKMPDRGPPKKKLARPGTRPTSKKSSPARCPPREKLFGPFGIEDCFLFPTLSKTVCELCPTRADLCEFARPEPAREAPARPVP